MDQLSARNRTDFAPDGLGAESITTDQGRAGITSRPILEARKISKRFLGVQALNDVTLTLRGGEIVALLGADGAGKSTLVEILSGAVSPDGGEIVINGEHVEIESRSDAERHGIVTVYQELELFPSVSVTENLFLSHCSEDGKFLRGQERRQFARETLARLGIDRLLGRPVPSLGIAEQYMVEIGKALVCEARIVILDEPTAVLASGDVEELLRIVCALPSHGVGVLFIPHRLDEVFGLADRYVLLREGMCVADGLISETSYGDLASKMVAPSHI